MLFRPSNIIQSMGFKTVEEYGYEVYKKLLVRMDSTKNNTKQKADSGLFLSSFVDKQDGKTCYDTVMQRIDKNFEQSSTEVDFIALPPLFFYSSKDEISMITPQLIIVLCESGPIIPVVFSKNNRTLHGDEQLPNHIMRLYRAKSSKFVTLENLKQVLDG